MRQFIEAEWCFRNQCVKAQNMIRFIRILVLVNLKQQIICTEIEGMSKTYTGDCIKLSTVAITEIRNGTFNEITIDKARQAEPQRRSYRIELDVYRTDIIIIRGHL